MEKEKKKITMSLWTFYVLITGIVLLITALIFKSVLSAFEI